MTTIAWKIDSLEVKVQENELSDVVCVIHWRLHAQEGNVATSNYGSMSVGVPDEDEFIPFDELEEATVIGWVHDAMGEEAVAAAETSVAAQLANLLAPAIINKPLPWIAGG